MDIKVNHFYANDHLKEDGITETNILKVISTRNSNPVEVSETFYCTETMLLVGGNIDSIHENDWLGTFLQREATEEEIEVFNYFRKANPQLKHWAEEVTGVWIEK